MLSLLFLVPIALLLTALMIWAFIWAVRDGQYLDLDRAGKEALYDEVKTDRVKPGDLPKGSSGAGDDGH